MDKTQLIAKLHSRNWVGILKFQSKNKYPCNKKHVPKYLWQPLDSQNCPEFLVSSNQLKKMIHSQYTVIQFKEWPTSAVRPTGTVVTYLGPVGDTQAEIQARLHYHKLSIPRWKFNPPPLEQLLSEAPHKDYTHLSVYSIDPPGCRDIDDAFSYQSDNRILGIHIADVTYLLKKYGLLDDHNKFEGRYASVYLPNKINHLLPEKISTDQASLLPGVKRLAWTLWLQLSENYLIENSYWERTLIINQKAFSYDEADRSPIIQEILLITQKLSESLFQTIKSHWTTHEMIESLMVIVNHFLALKIQTNMKNGIFRIHAEKKNMIAPYLTSMCDPDLNKFLNILDSQSAEYAWDTGNYYHYGLSLDKYTHFTSPIRRWVDIYNHLLLEELIYGNKDPNYRPWEVDLANVNDFNQRTKRLQRDLDKISMIEACQKKQLWTGYIIGTHPRYQIYFPEPKLLINIRLWSDKINHLIQVEEKDNIIIINQMFEIHKYKLQKFKLYAQPKANRLSDKIKVEIDGLSEYLNTFNCTK